MRIFVQIAAYRDSELCPSLRSLFSNAASPDSITVGLCWQHSDSEHLEEFADDSRIRRVSVPAAKSRGVCWARSITQALYRGEEFTLQLDSHHRFAPGWDRSLIDAYQKLLNEGVKKPIISAYLPAYEPGASADEWEQRPLRIGFGGFTERGPWAVKPEYIEHTEEGQLEAAHFLSGHFLFAKGEFCREVSYDPKLYFFGEEQSLTLRAFTLGYRFYHPLFVCCWHHYGRATMPKHWSDDAQWWAKNERSMRRYNRLLTQASDSESRDPHGLGEDRSLADFAGYAGIDAVNRTITPRAAESSAASALLPGSQTLADAEGAHNLCAIRVPIDIRDCMIDDDTLSFIYVGVHDEHEGELFRYDVTGDALKDCLRDGYIDLVFRSAVRYMSWTTWPYGEKTGWQKARKIPVHW